MTEFGTKGPFPTENSQIGARPGTYTHSVTIPVTEEQRLMILDMARESGVSMATVLRHIIFGEDK